MTAQSIAAPWITWRSLFTSWFLKKRLSLGD
jgi:hypothetical protein